ncbi:hypothetical protein [Corynebacterium uterequi]|uniref:Uncharacterized protein n=1 Tax=Corynebacterium uterequi TaxID=1072256 RepID=A0A0G3HCK2_9CORY|nr:hypothetical protein [Corynebacterium uterequi]AKK10435.1 hypothetical protein CUTER_02100 [Corynebacterium uterequi]
MTKSLKVLAALIIAGFTVLVLFLAGYRNWYSQQPAAGFPTGGISAAVERADEANLTFLGVSHVDLYGPNYPLAVTVCPRMVPSDIAAQLQLPGAIKGIANPDEPVDMEHNYLVLIDQQGNAVADKLNRAEVDLCGLAQQAVIQPNQVMQFQKSEEGNWVLAG